MDVDRALARAAGGGSGGRAGLADFAVLLSGAATTRIEDMAQLARRITRARFGGDRTTSSPCCTSPTSASRPVPTAGSQPAMTSARRTLSVEEVEREAAEPHRRGFRHILLVSGEHARIVNRDYLVDCVRAVAPPLRPGGHRGPGMGHRYVPPPPGCRLRRRHRLPGGVRPDDLFRRAPQGQEAQLRLATRRARPGCGGRYAPAGNRRPSGPGPGLAVRGHRPGGPRAGLDPTLVALRS